MGQAFISLLGLTTPEVLPTKTINKVYLYFLLFVDVAESALLLEQVHDNS